MSTDGGPQSKSPTPLFAVCALTFLASIGTGVVWNAVSFIAKNDYRLSQLATFWLYVFMGGIYVLGALAAGPLLRGMERRLSPRSVLALILLAQAALCCGPLLSRSQWVLWLVAGVTSALSSVLWPVVESYVTAGRHGPQMRNAIGIWNLTWTGATAISMYAVAPLIDENARNAIIALVPVNLIAGAVLLCFHPWPGEHLHEHAQEHVGKNYPMLLRSARILLPLSYVMNAALTPLMPYLLSGMSVHEHAQTPITGLWMAARFFTMLVMWRAAFWHGRWGTLLLGCVLLASGFGAIVSAPALALLCIGLALFGVGMGIIYFAAIYYALAVGRAEIDAGGTHEALIGVGYTLGPGAGLAGYYAAQSSSSLRMEPVIIGIVWGLTIAVSLSVYRAYCRSTASRR